MAQVHVGDQVYLEEGGSAFGAVRGIQRHGLNIYVENSGDFDIRAEAVKSVHDGKVILLASRLGPALRTAIAHAHTAERR